MKLMDKLEERVDPKGRRFFENFLRQVNKLQAEQQLEARSLIEGGGSPPGSSSKNRKSSPGPRAAFYQVWAGTVR